MGQVSGRCPKQLKLRGSIVSIAHAWRHDNCPINSVSVEMFQSHYYFAVSWLSVTITFPQYTPRWLWVSYRSGSFHRFHDPPIIAEFLWNLTFGIVILYLTDRINKTFWSLEWLTSSDSQYICSKLKSNGKFLIEILLNNSILLSSIVPTIRTVTTVSDPC